MADSLTKSLLQRLGIRLPGIGMPDMPEVTPEQQQLQEELVKREQAKWNPTYTKALKNAEQVPDFFKGIFHDPTQTIGPDQSMPYAVGSLAGVLPFGPKGIKGLYSKAERIAENLPKMLPASELRGIFKNRVSPRESEWRGLRKLTEGRGTSPITRDEIIKHLEENPLDVKVIEKGHIPEPNFDLPDDNAADDLVNNFDTSTIYHDRYEMPGASNYRETLIQLDKPNAKGINASIEADELNADLGTPESATNKNNDFLSHHWDEPNVVVATRWNERHLPPMQGTGKNIYGMGLDDVQNTYRRAAMQAPPQQEAQVAVGPKGRMLENIQSDWEQKGANAGYVSKGQPVDDVDSANADLMNAAGDAKDHLEQLTSQFQEQFSSYLDPEEIYGLGDEDISGYIIDRLQRAPNRAGIDRADLPEMVAVRQLQRARILYDNALDAHVRGADKAVPNMPFKGRAQPATLALKQQLLDIAHNRPDTKWIGIAPSSELRTRGEVIDPTYQDKILPEVLEKLFRQAGGPPVPAKDATWVRPQMTDLGPGAKRGPVFDFDPHLGPHGGFYEESRGGSRVDEVLNMLPGQDRYDASRMLESRVPNPVAPIGFLSPELLKQIRDKGFNLAAFLAMLQASQNKEK